MITSFGIVSIGTAFVKSYAGLLVIRVFLGLAEGGTLVCDIGWRIRDLCANLYQSGLTYILSRVSTRIAIFHSCFFLRLDVVLSSLRTGTSHRLFRRRFPISGWRMYVGLLAILCIEVTLSRSRRITCVRSSLPARFWYRKIMEEGE